MAILTRVNRKEYPGAITEITDPFTCATYPTIQTLANFLMGSGEPSVIIEGKIYTEETKADIEVACTP